MLDGAPGAQPRPGSCLLGGELGPLLVGMCSFEPRPDSSPVEGVTATRASDKFTLRQLWEHRGFVLAYDSPVTLLVSTAPPALPGAPSSWTSGAPPEGLSQSPVPGQKASGCTDDSAVKALAAQAKRPEFKSQMPQKMVGGCVSACVCLLYGRNNLMQFSCLDFKCP